MLGRFPGTEWSTASAVSGEGSVIVGHSNPANQDGAFFWTTDLGIVNLRGFLISQGVEPLHDWTLTSADDISADGRTIIGMGLNPQGEREGWMATIPEPSGFVLAAAAFTGLLLWRMHLRATTCRTLCLLLTISAAIRPETLEAQYSITRLGNLPGSTVLSRALGVSADGSVVVGDSVSTNGFEAFRWTRADGMVGLGFLGDAPGINPFSSAEAASADGSVIVGESTSANGTREAFRWTAGHGMVGLGYVGNFPGSDPRSYARDVSDDGLVVVGSSTSPNARVEAFRWSPADGMVALGDLPGDVFFSEARAVSGDGMVIGGSSNSANGTEAFRWTAAEGMVGLGDLPDGQYQSFIYSASHNGSVLGGHGNSHIGVTPFRWTAAEGMVSLQDRQVLYGGTAQGMTPDGSMIVSGGIDPTTLHNAAFFWTTATGWVNLENFLISQGVTDFGGVSLSIAMDVSADGKTIVGIGTNSQGQTEAWIATIPEPSSVVLASLAVVLLVLAKTTRWRSDGGLYHTTSRPSDKPW